MAGGFEDASTVPESDTFEDMEDFQDELSRVLSLASGLDPADVSRALVQAAGEILHPEVIEGEVSDEPPDEVVAEYQAARALFTQSGFAQEFAKLHAPGYFAASTPDLTDEDEARRRFAADMGREGQQARETPAQTEWAEHAGKRDDA